MDPLIKLAIDIQNSEKIKALTADLTAQKQSIVSLNAALAAGTVNQHQYNASMAAVGTQAKATTAALHALQNATGSPTQGLLQLSYAADDAAYGFSAIVNNIPGIVMAFGGTAGIAGAVAIAGVGIRTLINHWGELTDQFNSWTTGKPVSELDALRKKTEETAEAFDRLTKAKTSSETKQKTETEEAIIEGPAGKIFADLVGKILGDTQILPAGRKATQHELDVDVFRSPGTPDIQSRLDTGRLDQAKEMAKRIMGGGAKPGIEQKMLTEVTEESRHEIVKKQHGGQAAIDDRIKADIAAQRSKMTSTNSNVSVLDEERKRKTQEGATAARLAASERVKADIARGIAKDEHKSKTQADSRKILFDDDKTKKMQALEDQRTAIQRQLHAEEEKIWQKGHGQRPGQILGGAKEALDMYQKAGQGDTARELAKKSHDLQEAANKKLQVIADAVTKQQRRKLELEK